MESRARRSIRPENNARKGCEFVSPILKGVDGVRQIENAIDQINARGGQVNSSCGLHITVSWNGDAAALARLISLVGNHERAIYASTGTRKREQMMYAKRIKQYGNKDNAKSRCESDRYHLLNLTHLTRGKNRIEFRAFGGTLNKTKVVGYLMMVLVWLNSPSIPNAAANGTTSKRKAPRVAGSPWCRPWRDGTQPIVLPTRMDQGLVQGCPSRQGLRRDRQRNQTGMENDQNQAPRPRPQIRPRGIDHNQTKRRTRRFGFHTFGDVGPILRHRGVESCMSLIVAKPEPQHNAARLCELTRSKKHSDSFCNPRRLGLRLFEPHGSCVSSRKRFHSLSETEKKP